MISCESDNYGTLTFTSFHLAGSGVIVASSCAINVSDNIINASLSGDTVQNVWRCTTPTLVEQDDIPEAINAALGYTPADPRHYAVSVKTLGAKGDGSTDDTAVFQSALTNYRTVFVPGGIYKLSDNLLIRDNCELELSQDTGLEFTMTSGNCISMKYSASIRGHHATIRVPYMFSGNVIYVSSTLDTNVLQTPPFTRWDPQWKAGRYITDLNIVMPDTRGFHYSMVLGDCSGTAVYLSADGEQPIDTQSTFIWGLNFSGIRIAGAFEYGIRAQNFNEGWNHEMRIEAVIEACEIGVSLEDCNNAYISAIIQPKPGYIGEKNYFPYAKHGIQLIRSKNTNLLGSRVWDWDAKRTLWTQDGIYQHIAMYGDCEGTILDDFYYYAVTSNIRDLIYTDTPSNLEKMIILQEPLTRWFKPIEHEPYFNNGVDGNQRLLLKSEQDVLFNTKQIPNFINRLPLAVDDTGAVYNGIGYKKDTYIDASTGLESTKVDYQCAATGYIPCKSDSILRFSGIKWDDYGFCGILLYNAQKEKLQFMSSTNIRKGTSYFYSYSETVDGFEIGILDRAEQLDAAFFRITLAADGISTKPVIAVDEEISYKQEGFLADGIYISADYVHGGVTEAAVDAKIAAAIGNAIGGSY